MAVRGKRGEAQANGAGEPAPSETVESEATEPGPGHNTQDGLTEEQSTSLTFQWMRGVLGLRLKIDDAQDVVKGHKSDLSNAYKQIKAEIGAPGLARVKRLVEFKRDADGEATLREELHNLVFIAKWMNALPGQQLELYDDMRPTDDRAYADGRRDGIQGDAFNPKYGQGTLAYNRYQEGYVDGQGMLASKIKPLNPESLGAPEQQEAPTEPAAQPAD